MKATLVNKICFFVLAIGLYANFINCACLDAPTTGLSVENDAVNVDKEIIDSLNKFPQLDDVEYKIRNDLTKNGYLTSLCNFNNGSMNKVIQAIDQHKKSNPPFNFLSLANDPGLQNEIAERANVDVLFVRLYLSRAIAWHVRATEDPQQVALKIRLCRNFWDDKQIYLLRSLLHIEDLLLVGLSKAQESLTNLAFYSAQSADLICTADPISIAACRKISADHLPFTCILLKSRYALLCGKFIKKIPFDQGSVMQQDLCIREMIQKKEAILDQVRKVFVQSPDLFLQKIAFSIYHNVYIWLLWQYYSLIYVNYGYIYNCLIDVLNWKIPSKNPFVVTQIKRLIQSVAMHDHSAANHELTLKNHYLTLLLEMFLDYQGLSMMIKLPQLIHLAEDVTTSLYQKAGGAHIQQSYKTADDIIQELQSSHQHKDALSQLLQHINSVLDAYGTDSFPFESVFDKEFASYEGKTIDPIFRMTCKIEKERIHYALVANPIEKKDPAAQNSTQPTVNYLMQTYFPDEQSARKAVHQNTKKSKKTKKRDNPLFQEKRSVTLDDDVSADATSTGRAIDRNMLAKQQTILRYHSRVLRWFDPQFTKEYEQESVIYHTLPPFIDTFLEKEGAKDLWNGNPRFSLPAKITRSDGSYAYVICSCTITKDGQIYHRGFDFTTRDAIKQRLGIDIPEDSSVQTDEYKEDPFVVVFRNKRFQNRSLLLDDNEKYVMLYDPINKLYVQLFHRHASST